MNKRPNRRGDCRDGANDGGTRPLIAGHTSGIPTPEPLATQQPPRRARDTLSFAPGIDLARARTHILARLEALGSRLGVNPADDTGWRDYVTALDLLLRLEDRLGRQEANHRHAFLTTREMAERLGISVKTLLARKKRGHIRPSVSHGKALGWRLEDALR